MSSGLALVYHNLSLMLDAGVPLVRTLNTVSSGLKSNLKPAFVRLAESVANGNSLSTAMEKNRAVFAPLDVMLTRAAEVSGELPRVFALLSQWYELTGRARQKMLSGLILPFAVFHIAAFIFPVPLLVLRGWDSGVYLRNVFQILLVLYIPALVIYVIATMTPRRGLPRRCLDWLVLRIPVLGQAVYYLSISRYCRLFYVLSAAGLPITDCADYAAKAVGNAVVADLFRPGTASARAGANVSEGFSRKLPSELHELWRVGEETGKMDEVTAKLAEIFEDRGWAYYSEFARWFPRLVYALVCLIMIGMILALIGRILSSYTVPI